MDPNVLISKKVPNFMCRYCAERPRPFFLRAPASSIQVLHCPSAAHPVLVPSLGLPTSKSEDLQTGPRLASAGAKNGLYCSR